MTQAAMTFTLTGPDPLMSGMWRDLNANGNTVTNLKAPVAANDAARLADVAAVASSLAPVATSGAYADLTGKPTLGTAAPLNSGTSNGTVPVLGASGLPAVGGSLLTGLTKAQVGLGSVDNTADTAKPISVLQQAALDLKATTSSLGTAAYLNTGTASGNIPLLGVSGLPAIGGSLLTGLTKTQVGLGNVDNTSDATKNAATATLTNKTLTAPVINSPTGIVKGDVGLGNVDNTSDATKNAAVATLANKTLASPVINSPTGLVKADVGLGSVDNTSDASKPVSTATQAALDAKAPLISPVLVSPTLSARPATSDNSALIPDTKWVNDAISGAVSSGVADGDKGDIVVSGTGTVWTVEAAPIDARIAAAVGASVQAYDPDLTTWAGITPASGVGTFLATPSSANLRAALTDETGTGVAVFATSPTLVTPNLGTPSAATLTNATGLPVATGVAGLGTGVAAFLATPSSTNLAAAVTGETGSGALVFATSPTLVTPVLGAASATSLTLSADPSTAMQAATKQYVDAGAVQVVALSTGATAAVNAATLQAAINAASNTTIYLPAGAFPMNAVTLKPGVRLQGKGKEVTRLLCGSNSIAMLSYTAATTQFYFSIRDIGFEVNGKTGAAAISIDGASSAIRISNVEMSHIEVSGAFAVGVAIRFCANSHLSDIFTSLATIGFQIDNCADTELMGCRAQNGAGAGFNIVGGAGAFDEGIRMTSCSTNGQFYGMVITGQEWGLASACSFTTCPGGALLTTGTVSNWKFSACDFATAGVTPAAANVTLAASSSSFSFSACQFVLGTFGVAVSGSDHTFTGNTFVANSNVDLYVSDATGLVVTGNIFRSTTVSWSVLEAGTADGNVYVGNKCAKLTTIVGANSVVLEHLSVGFSRIQGGFSRGIPVVKTANYTVGKGENWVVNNKGSSMTVTLPAAVDYPGREIMMKTITAFTVVSASANVVPRNGSSGGTAILAATAGAWCMLVSDGANWVIMQGG